MIKGPKAILSSAIANALGEYFVVDANAIESNLLKDAKIVLRNVRLKEQISRIPVNSAGKTTVVTVNGTVEEAAFTWTWAMGDAVWLTDAVLTISGAKFRAKLEHEERAEDEEDDADILEPERTLSEAFVDPSKIDTDSAKTIKVEKGGLSGFMERQVKMVMDMLTLRLVDFEIKIRIVLPHDMSQQPAGGDDNVGVSATGACDKVLAVGGEKIEVLSYGRDGGQDGTVADGLKKLKMRINLSSFVCGVHLEGKVDGNNVISYPLLEPLSYSADVTRLSGDRFGGMLTGLEVMGLGQAADLCPDIASLTGSGLAVHMGKIQVDTLMQLSVMMLAPPDDTANTSCSDAKAEEKLSKKASSSLGPDEPPSTFALPLSSASLVLFEEKRFCISCITMRYTADGTVCRVEAGKMEYECDSKARATATDVVMSMRPAMKMTVGCIEKLYIPDTILLSTPIRSCEIIYEGSTMAMKLDSIDAVTFSKKDAGPSGPMISAPYLPFNINLDVEKGIQIKKSEDGSLTKFGRCHVYALKEERCAKIAMELESFRNYLIAMNTVSFCGSIPWDQVDTIDDFIFTAGDVKIMSGHSTDEWSEAFTPRKAKAATIKQSKAGQSQSSKLSVIKLPEWSEAFTPGKAKTEKVKQSKAELSQSSKSSVIKLPNCNMTDLKVVIGLEASHKIGKVKDTSLTIKAFKGKAETTSKDLINYYTKACLSRFPDFITNVEVLGLNVVDSTTGLWATFAGAGLGLGSAFGAGAGVAAITAVDAVKGSVDAGKRSRNVSEDANWKPGDLMRGLVQAAGEATRDGAALRGKGNKDGNLIDWTVGATTNTADYVVENKNRLGAAGAGGGGFLLGMALGGPIGAVIGGLAATATTGASLEFLDEKIGQKEAKKIEDSKEKTTKSKK